ncbi:MAG: acetoacetate--CoA ligase, partial [Candidatus Nucleicultricaceae bacterium]
WDDLHQQVSQMAQALKHYGVGKGDRVAGFMPNMPETIVAMLATASLGAIWSSCAPEFGLQGVLDRFGQIEPTVLIATDGYLFHGKIYDCREKVHEMIKNLPSVQKTIMTPYVYPKETLNNDQIIYYDMCLSAYSPKPITFERVNFNHPLFVLYSSGTTGMPKCIVHGHGGTLLQLMKEHQLHSDIKPSDRVFYYTTCGWMMWNWLVTALASKASIVLYDGSPLAPDSDVLFNLSDAYNVTHFGASAKYFDALKKVHSMPGKTHKLESLKYVLSTGSPLVAETFDYIYESIDRDICLSSISGGTDIVSCFMVGNPIGPVWRGELQSRGLGLQVEVFDENGKSVREKKGELVCTAPFPAMPLGFWGDEDGSKFHKAYFSDYPNVWSHRDYVEITSHNGVVIYGRSDATLNPGGVRIGTAEIYRQVEKIAAIEESLVVGQDWHDDVRIILFVKLKKGHMLDDALRDSIITVIKKNTTPRHVPKKIIAVPDIPRTMSGKIVELAVHNVIEGLPVKNSEALANPEALLYFKNIEALQED